MTGGAGFIGSTLVKHLLKNEKYSVVNLDSLTYAGNLNSLKSISNNERYFFENVDICDMEIIDNIFNQYKPDAVVHLAAESHVDRSISNSYKFIKTNILGTHTLLETSLKYWSQLPHLKKSTFRFLHVSTDEVYGDLGDSTKAFVEDSRYDPSSPYSASKASSDHLVRAWGRTYKLPILVTNCSNNYGPYQFPEKFIPTVIINLLKGLPVPVYGSGNQVRDWLHVDDHVRALSEVLKRGVIGHTYNIGGCNEIQNIKIVNLICSFMDELESTNKQYDDLITFVPDRPGHDFKYAIDSSKIKRDLGWKTRMTFYSGLQKTVEWYFRNQSWWEAIIDGSYQNNKS